MTSKYALYYRFENGFAVCLICPEETTKFKFPKGSSTSGVKKHLLHAHDINVGAPVVDRSPLTAPLLDCVLHHDLPFALVECPCFRNFVEACRVSQTPVPCASTLQDYLAQSSGAKRSAGETAVLSISLSPTGPLDEPTRKVLHWSIGESPRPKLPS